MTECEMLLAEGMFQVIVVLVIIFIFVIVIIVIIVIIFIVVFYLFLQRVCSTSICLRATAPTCASGRAKQTLPSP